MESNEVVAPKEAKMTTIPVVQYKGFKFPIRSIKETDWATPVEGVLSPESVIRELRAHVMTLDDRLTLVLAAVSLTKDPEVQEFLRSIGLQVVDVHRNPFPPIPTPDPPTQN